MTIEDEPPVLSGVDRVTERRLLATTDLAGLQRRIEHTIVRRTWWTGFTAGVAAVAVLAVISLPGIGAVRGGPPTNAPVSAPAAATTTATVTTLQPCPLPDAAPPTTTATTTTTTTTATTASTRTQVTPAVVEIAAEARPPVDGSRLRTQLRIFADGERALASGDPARAQIRARHLREAWPGGPLDMDAAVLEVRALRALGDNDGARRALAEAEHHPQAAEKTAVLAELRASLTPSVARPIIDDAGTDRGFDDEDDDVNDTAPGEGALRTRP
jgi:hypothetical protein